jgi:hypothetical protein
VLHEIGDINNRHKQTSSFYHHVVIVTSATQVGYISYNGVYSSLDMVSVAPNQIPWIQPPPITPNPKVHLNKFKQVTLLSGEIVMKFVGKKHDVSAMKRCYDCAGGRVLAFSAPIVPPPGILQISAYGLLAPDMHLVVVKPFREAVRDVPIPTRWMYLNPHIHSSDIGLIMPPPNPLVLSTMDTLTNAI